jgi:Family of unknown function (DUF6082)
MTGRRSRFVFIVSIAGVVLAALFIAAFSPFALRAVAFWPGMDWAKLSNIGQAYGAVSAIVAALALAGVAASIFVQIREVRHNRWEAGRARHFELMRIAMEDPFYRQVFSLEGISEDTARLFGYINMILEYWTMLWEFGDATEYQLRKDLKDILATKAGRSYWNANRDVRREYARTRREIEFHEIADEIFQELSASDSISKHGSIDVDRPRSEVHIRPAIKAGGMLAVGAICGALITRMLKYARERMPGQLRAGRR